MTISAFWQTLDSVEGVSTTLSSGAARQLGAVCAELNGKTLAVDVSTWLAQAQTQPALTSVGFSGDGCCLKVVFDRVLNWLRCGVTPVGVLDGEAPPEKIGRLLDRGYTRRPGAVPMRRQSELAAQVFDALGLTCVRAPGEAEALAAALDAGGFVHGVHSGDADSLTFGARKLYRRIHLEVNALGNCQVEVTEAGAVLAAAGLRIAGGTELLTALSLLAGCDYAVEGARGVGARGVLSAAAELLRSLRPDATDDTGLLDHLAALLRSPSDDELAALDARGCTGCAKCRHEGGLASRCAQHAAKRGCVGCGTASGCLAAPEGTPCACAWHTGHSAILLHRLLRRAAATPGFIARYDAGVAAYRAGAAAARVAAARVAATGLGWMRRPDVGRLTELMAGLGPGVDGKAAGYSAEAVQRKLLPLLLLWDLQNPASPAACFALAAVTGRSGRGAAMGGGTGDVAGGASAHCVAWAALPGREAAAASAGLAQAQALGKEGDVLLRTVWTATLRQAAPGALAACERVLAEKEAAAVAKAAKSAAARAKRETKAAVAARAEASQPKISALLPAARPSGAIATQCKPRRKSTNEVVIVDDSDSEDALPTLASLRAPRAAAPPSSMPVSLGKRSAPVGTPGSGKKTRTPPERPPCEPGSLASMWRRAASGEGAARKALSYEVIDLCSPSP